MIVYLILGILLISFLLGIVIWFLFSGTEKLPDDISKICLSSSFAFHNQHIDGSPGFNVDNSTNIIPLMDIIKSSTNNIQKLRLDLPYKLPDSERKPSNINMNYESKLIPCPSGYVPQNLLPGEKTFINNNIVISNLM